MSIFDIFKKEVINEIKPEPTGQYRPLFHISYDGEKNSGELGVLTKYNLDYNGLRLRSWQSYLDNDITRTVVSKFSTWVIGSGLKLQSEPIDLILKSEGISVSRDLTRLIEARFKIFCNSKDSDYSGINNINRLAKTCKVNAIVGGDVLVILRTINKNLNVQLVDGYHVQTPFYGDEVRQAEERGNVIKNGIEQTKSGEHVAFFVKNSDLTYTRVLAKGKTTGKEQAFLVYGSSYRLDDNRGIPLMSTVLETLKKLDRYKEATVGSAEERAKIVYSIEHKEYSTGENPLAKNLAKAFDVDAKQEIATDVTGAKLANTVAVSTDKQTFNMPQGASLKALDSQQELSFKDFHTTNAALICSTVGIPPEVAFSKYDSNFSASRAALKDWEHTINVERSDIQFQFYQKIYNYWLDLEILKQKINAPGYLTALAKKDNTILDSYRNARFVGANVPHIDPLKEVNAERMKLGESGKYLPLTTAEAATEALNGGEYSQNLEKYSQELELSIKKNVKQPETQPIKTEK